MISLKMGTMERPQEGLQRPTALAAPAAVTLGNRAGVTVGAMADSSGALADTAECAPAPAPPSWHLQAAAAAHRLSHLLTIPKVYLWCTDRQWARAGCGAGLMWTAICSSVGSCRAQPWPRPTRSWRHIWSNCSGRWRARGHAVRHLQTYQLAFL